MKELLSNMALIIIGIVPAIIVYIRLRPADKINVLKNWQEMVVNLSESVKDLTHEVDNLRGENLKLNKILHELRQENFSLKVEIGSLRDFLEIHNK